MSQGVLILVVGPSGAGKDTLIGEARARLQGDDRFVFPRRVVTRGAVAAAEDHDSLTPDQFALKRQCGSFALDWDAHGLSYGLTAASLDAALLVGRTVVANVSRSVIGRAVEKYPRTAVILVTAAVDIRAARLARRGRERQDAIAARLAHEGAELPRGVFATIVDNSGTVEDGSRHFLHALIRAANEPRMGLTR